MTIRVETLGEQALGMLAMLYKDSRPAAIHLQGRQVFVRKPNGQAEILELALDFSWPQALLGNRMPENPSAVFMLELPWPTMEESEKAGAEPRQPTQTFLRFKAISLNGALTLFPIWRPIGNALACSDEPILHFPALKSPLVPDWPTVFETSRGLVIISGERRSGRTITAMSLINRLRENRKIAMGLIERAAEHALNETAGFIERVELGFDGNWPEAVNLLDRRNFDVIYLEEIPDVATLNQAISAAESRLVIACGPSRSVTETLECLLEMEPDRARNEGLRRRLARVLVGIIGQVLVPNKGGSALAPATEILVKTPAVHNLIREDKTFRILESMRTGHKYGMLTLNEDLLRLVNGGYVDKEAALAASYMPEELEELLGKK
ncbi:MAG: hypothetical protein WC518_02540 [Patescibacteria group bacterium]